jgi:hypothetical protein
MDRTRFRRTADYTQMYHQATRPARNLAAKIPIGAAAPLRPVHHHAAPKPAGQSDKVTISIHLRVPQFRVSLQTHTIYLLVAVLLVVVALVTGYQHLMHHIVKQKPILTMISVA